jgi:two-component system sensor histidine kinase BaeS
MTSDLERERLDVLVHEVRSPVAALSAVAEAAAGAPADLSRRQLTRLALAASHAIERIVLDFSVASVHLEGLDAAMLVRDAVAAFSVRGASVVAEGGGRPLVVDADPVRLRQVLDNLIANALTHAGAGGLVTVRVAAARDNVEIAVSDAGRGIPLAELARIFQPGVRLDADTTGSGLGLAVSRAIVEAHGGTIAIDSIVGEGSTFTIVLPRRPSHPAT